MVAIRSIGKQLECDERKKKPLNGFFFNKIPLLKELKWREVASFKAIYGGLDNENNPSLHPALYQFPVTSTGQPLTYALGNTPYMEGSVGIENIFKIVRLDLVRRFLRPKFFVDSFAHIKKLIEKTPVVPMEKHQDDLNRRIALPGRAAQF